MIPISSTICGELSWSKTSYKRDYELKRNGEVVASLRQTSFWATEFQAESAHGSWKFRRTGCFQTGTEIVDANSDAESAFSKGTGPAVEPWPSPTV